MTRYGTWYLNWQELVLTYMPVWFLQEDSNHYIQMYSDGKKIKHRNSGESYVLQQYS